MLVLTVSKLSDLNIPCDLLEIRADYFEDLSFLKIINRPYILTFRRKEEGGALDISENERLSRIENLLPYLPTYLDLETSTDKSFIYKVKKNYPTIELIGSFHDFEKTPLNLEKTFENMQYRAFSYYKLALFANSSLDMLRLMAFKKKTKALSCAISMGQFGAPSRVIGKIVGNEFDYVGVTEDPFLGRLSLEELKNTYRYDRLNESTQLFALIGDPIQHSIGHIFHNRYFDDGCVYVKIRLNEKELKTFFELFEKIGGRGLSVTMPLKKAVIEYLSDVSSEIIKMQSVNTVLFQNSQRFGFNTDAAAVIDLLKDVQGKNIAILGAGSTARAIGFKLFEKGANLLFFNRTIEKALNLAADLNAVGLHLDDFAVERIDILINTLPRDASFIPKLKKDLLVLDIVYPSLLSPIIQEAKKLGCMFITGEEMFYAQALRQQKVWKTLR